MTALKPVLDHLPHWRRDRLCADLADAHGHGLGIDMNDDHDGPVFYEVSVPLVGADSSLGHLCATVSDAISEEFHRFGLRMPVRLRAAVTSGAMMAGNYGGYDSSLAYLLRWVAVRTEED